MYPAIFTEIRLIHKKPLKTQLNTCMEQSGTISRDWIDEVPFTLAILLSAHINQQIRHSASDVF